MYNPVDFINSLIKNKKFNDELIYAYIAAKVCYNKNDLSNIIMSIDHEKIVPFLKNLSQKGHLSIFEHAYITVDLNKVIPETWSFDKMLYYLSEDLVSLLYQIADISQPFPFYNDQAHKEISNNTWKFLTKLILRNYFNIPYVSNEHDCVIINMRHYLELLKKYGDEEQFWKTATLSNYSEPLSKIEVIPLSDNSNIFIIKKISGKPFGLKKSPIITFYLENVSRVLTHQLVRHRFQCSYSQRSDRYTTPENPTFIVPNLSYINAILPKGDKKVESDLLIKSYKEKINKSFNDIYKDIWKKYLYFIDGSFMQDVLQEEDKKIPIRKEDARYILPQGCGTNIMVTMGLDGLKNFIMLRNKKEAQDEIRKVAKIIERKI